MYLYIYIYTYTYIYICYHENNVSSRLLPQCLCGSSCTWEYVHHVPKCMSCHKAIVLIIRTAHCSVATFILIEIFSR